MLLHICLSRFDIFLVDIEVVTVLYLSWVLFYINLVVFIPKNFFNCTWLKFIKTWLNYTGGQLCHIQCRYVAHGGRRFIHPRKNALPHYSLPDTTTTRTIHPWLIRPLDYSPPDYSSPGFFTSGQSTPRIIHTWIIQHARLFAPWLFTGAEPGFVSSSIKQN